MEILQKNANRKCKCIHANVKKMRTQSNKTKILEKKAEKKIEIIIICLYILLSGSLPLSVCKRYGPKVILNFPPIMPMGQPKNLFCYECWMHRWT